MKRIFPFIFVFVLVLFNTGVTQANAAPKVTLDGYIMIFDEPPVIENGQIMVPLQTIAEAMGAEYRWDDSTQTATVLYSIAWPDDVNIAKSPTKHSVGQTIARIVATVKINGQAYFDGDAIILDAPARIQNNCVLVPLNFISETFYFCDVSWDEANQTVSIKSNIGVILPLRNLGYNTQQLRRTLATSAIYDRVDNVKLNYFPLYSTLIEHPFSFEMQTKMLKNSWSINNKEDALRIFKWLREEGHRKVFNDYAEMISKLSDEQYNELLNSLPYNSFKANEIKLVKKHYAQLGDKSIIAWDLVRLANIAQDCCLAGYITREEAWDEIMYAARTTQNTFSSWEDMANNFLIGREFWAGENDERFSDAVNWLLTDNESPWLRYNWGMSLEKENVPPTVILNGQALSFDVPPAIENGSTLVPLRAIFEALGADVQWDGVTQTVTANKSGTEIRLIIGGAAYKNGQEVQLSVPAKIIEGRTMVPLRFVSEAFGCQVSWDGKTKTVNITNIFGTGIIKVHFIDVGQADAIYISLPNHKDILIDAGNLSDGHTIVNYLKYQGIDDVIDLVISTHQQKDHINGLFEVNNAYKVLETIDSDTDNYQTYKFGTTTLQILTGPDTWKNTNDNSVVCRLDTGDIEFLFMGDAGFIAESALSGDIASEIIKVGNHGSSTSTSAAFISVVNPEVVVISVGAENTCDCPSTETLQILQNAGATIYRTDLDGNIVITTDGKTYNSAVGSATLSPANNHQP